MIGSDCLMNYEVHSVCTAWQWWHWYTNAYKATTRSSLVASHLFLVDWAFLAFCKVDLLVGLITSEKKLLENFGGSVLLHWNYAGTMVIKPMRSLVWIRKYLAAQRYWSPGPMHQTQCHSAAVTVTYCCIIDKGFGRWFLKFDLLNLSQFYGSFNAVLPSQQPFQESLHFLSCLEAWTFLRYQLKWLCSILMGEMFNLSTYITNSLLFFKMPGIVLVNIMNEKIKSWLH